MAPPHHVISLQTPPLYVTPPRRPLANYISFRPYKLLRPSLGGSLRLLQSPAHLAPGSTHSASYLLIAPPTGFAPRAFFQILHAQAPPTPDPTHSAQLTLGPCRHFLQPRFCFALSPAHSRRPLRLATPPSAAPPILTQCPRPRRALAVMGCWAPAPSRTAAASAVAPTTRASSCSACFATRVTAPSRLSACA